MSLGPPLFLRVSVTDRCSARCVYCMPAAGTPRAPRNRVLSDQEILRFVRMLKAHYSLAQVRLTGGEPLLRAGIEKLVAALAAEDVADLSLTTNGQRLSGMAGPLRRAGLQRINVSLDSLDATTFAAITGGGVLTRTLDGILAARRSGLLPVKLNMVLLRGQNDHEVCGMVRFAIEQDCQMRFLELMPIGAAAPGFEERFVPASEVQERLAQEFRLDALPVDPRGTSRNFVAKDGRGGCATVGFISPSSDPFCKACPRLRLTSDGILIGCLARPEGIDVAAILRGGSPSETEALCAAVEQALGMKRQDRKFVQPWAMVGIGG